MCDKPDDDGEKDAGLFFRSVKVGKGPFCSERKDMWMRYFSGYVIASRGAG